MPLQTCAAGSYAAGPAKVVNWEKAGNGNRELWPNIPSFVWVQVVKLHLQSGFEWFLHNMSSAIEDLASEPTAFNIILESNNQRRHMLISSALVWAAVLGAEGGFDVNWLGTNTTETRFGLPLTVSAGNGSYWCIKSRQADPDLIILGHLKIYSPTPGSNTCPMSSLHATKTCPRVCPPSFAHHPLLSIRSICICCFIYCLYFFYN